MRLGHIESSSNKEQWPISPTMDDWQMIESWDEVEKEQNEYLKRICTAVLVVTLPSLLEKESRVKSMFRKRWDSDYLVDLAVNEGSFIAEYRVDPEGFDILHEMLYPMLDVESKMSDISNARSGSDRITVASRLGCTLIMLGGGRRIEAMRTHGVSSSFAYSNFHNVINAINTHPALAVECDNSLEGCKARAEVYQRRSDHDVFCYCTSK
jgi:hypothetical protein